MKLLFIEDDITFFNWLRIMLTKHSCSVAQNIAEAEEMLTVDNFDACFVDLNMPKYSAKEIVARARAAVPRSAPPAANAAAANFDSLFTERTSNLWGAPFVKHPGRFNVVQTDYTSSNAKNDDDDAAAVAADEKPQQPPVPAGVGLSVQALAAFLR